MRQTFFFHPITEIAATPRGYGCDSDMTRAIQTALEKLEQLENLESGYVIGLAGAQHLQRSLNWLLAYHAGCHANEDDHSLHALYSWHTLQRLDAELSKKSAI